MPGCQLYCVIIEFVYDNQLIFVIILFLLLKNKQETEYDIDGVARSLCGSTPIDNDSTSHSQLVYEVYGKELTVARSKYENIWTW